MKNKFKIIILLFLMLCITGCGAKNLIIDKNNKIVTSKETGQSLQREIYCKPSKNTETYKLYEKYSDQMKTKLEDLPECNKFKMNSTKTSSLWQFLFVKPLAFILLKLGNLFKYMGLTKSYLAVSLIVIGLLIRIIILPFNIKSQNQSKQMQKAMPEIKRIEKKYANSNDKTEMMMRASEIQKIYNKYKINPVLSCLLALIQLPIFFAFLQAIYKIPAIYEGEIFGYNLGTTPSVGLFEKQQYGYIILILLIILTTFFSFKYTMKQSQASNQEDGKNQMNTMLIVMTVLIGFTSFSLPTAIAIYWIVTYSFIIIQTYIMKVIEKNKDIKRNPRKKKINDKLKLKEGLKYGKNS
ncbi:MAG: YidC/Oxa1 family membrane protein insertase [Mollicutes bacterium]|nr:YidC/Oxa1 family membrane protein insertase [Mollicutes bacterium]